MSNYFLDSSALVKRYVSETGTSWVHSITNPAGGNVILVAQISQIEIFSAIMRRQREAAISIRTSQAIRLLINRHASREYHLVGLTKQVVQTAENLLERYPLRAYDTVQLASALESNLRLTAANLASITFVSSDVRLLNSAALEGLTIIDPNDQ